MGLIGLAAHGSQARRQSHAAGPPGFVQNVRSVHDLSSVFLVLREIVSPSTCEEVNAFPGPIVPVAFPWRYDAQISTPVPARQPSTPQPAARTSCSPTGPIRPPAGASRRFPRTDSVGRRLGPVELQQLVDRGPPPRVIPSTPGAPPYHPRRNRFGILPLLPLHSCRSTRRLSSVGRASHS